LRSRVVSPSQCTARDHTKQIRLQRAIAAVTENTSNGKMIVEIIGKMNQNQANLLTKERVVLAVVQSQPRD
jgi:hypothetical protein